VNELILADISKNIGELNGKFDQFLEYAKEQFSEIKHLDRRVQKLESYVEVERDRAKRPSPLTTFLKLLKGVLIR
jgi:archaellum component FlaC